MRSYDRYQPVALSLLLITLVACVGTARYAVAAPNDYAYQVNDPEQPDEKMYIKTNGNLVLVTPEGEKLIGQKAASTNPAYQWMITLEDGQEGFVDGENAMWSHEENDTWSRVASVVPLTDAKPPVAPPAALAAAPPPVVGSGGWAAGYEIVQASTKTGEAGSQGDVHVLCPAGKKVVDGGYWSNSGTEVWRVWRSRSVAEDGQQTGDRGWGLTFTSLTPEQLVWARAVCVPASLAGFEIVQARTTTGEAGSLGDVSVTCPGDKKVLGGGYWSNSGIEVWRVWRSHAADAAGKQPGDRGWALTFTSVVPGEPVWARATCASPSISGYEVVQANTMTAAEGSLGEVSVICPGNKRVLGGGFWSNSGIESWRIWRDRAVDDRGMQTGDRGWAVDFASVEPEQLVWVRAICASVQ